MFLCIWVLSAPFVFAVDPAQILENQEEKESYSIGYQVGLSMKTDGIEVDFDRLILGLKDAVNEKEPLLSTEEMRTLIVELKKKSRDAQMRKAQEQSAANTEESKIFIENNRTKEGVNTTESGLQYKVLKTGDGNSPGPEDSVTVNYKGTFIDGTEFDSSYRRGEPTTFKVNGVIKGWTEALQMMKPGDKWEIYLPPDLAYGRRGAPPTIQPNTALVFELELVSVKKPEKTTQETGVKNISLTGQIVNSRNGYIIRSRKGNAPGEIYTIRNPDPKKLDEFVKNEKIISIEARIISGDNLEILKIEGRPYN